ncbi:MAG: redoxin domain-containing protein [Ignavibacteriales bacterium]|nr:redoxin domain-containing protein [Ignavibacteriales bacterium]
MELLPRNIRAPELYGDFWFNSEPLAVRDLRGSVLLVDFWDFTSVNCLRSLPYVKDWRRKYADYGLVVISVHTPEFQFGWDPEVIESALKNLKVDFPVVCDNKALVWNAFGARYWPTKFIIDKDGFIRYVHTGEGSYDQLERAIQSMLAEAGIRGELPQLTEPFRDTDVPGVVCYRTTGEVRTGYLRGALGNVEGYSPESTLEYVDQGIYLPGRFYAEGKFLSDREFFRFNGAKGETGHISVPYQAAEVNAVMSSEDGSPCRVLVHQDGEWVADQDRGNDLLGGTDGATSVMVDSPRMFNLIKNREFGEHLLHLTIDSPSLRVYAFSFVTAPIPEVIPTN